MKVLSFLLWGKLRPEKNPNGYATKVENLGRENGWGQGWEVVMWRILLEAGGRRMDKCGRQRAAPLSE